MLSTMSMNLYIEAGNAMKGMHIGGTDRDKKNFLKSRSHDIGVKG